MVVVVVVVVVVVITYYCLPGMQPSCRVCKQASFGACARINSECCSRMGTRRKNGR